jgi:N-acetylglutamate synthase-like GNAT family acetyltransferase
VRRATVSAREAVVGDIPGLLELYDQLRAAGPRRSLPGLADTGQTRESAAERFEMIIADPEQRLLVAEDTSGMAGMVLCTVGTTSTLSPTRAVVLSHLTVAAHARRGGVGRVLIAAATQWADDLGFDHLRVAVFAASREANRFFARLGFAPISVNRVAPVSGLRRILGAEVPAAEANSGDIARRRRLRLGITTGPRPAAAVPRRRGA